MLFVISTDRNVIDVVVKRGITMAITWVIKRRRRVVKIYPHIAASSSEIAEQAGQTKE
jgi:hypothetical protein